MIFVIGSELSAARYTAVTATFTLANSKYRALGDSVHAVPCWSHCW